MISRRAFVKTGLLFVPAVVRAQLPVVPLQRTAVASGGAPFTAFGGVTLGGSLRNDTTGCLGFEFTSSVNIHVTTLGRWKVSGNSATHTLKVCLMDGTVLGSAVLDLSGGTVAAFNYIALASSVALTAGTHYVISSDELNGGDQWYNETGTIPTSVDSHITVVASVFSVPCASFSEASGGRTYGPLNFKGTIP